MNHTLMLSKSGHVYSIGSNQFGQLGLGTTNMENQLLPCLLESLKDEFITDIESGNEHCLALSECQQKIYAWGQGKYGALGTSRS